MQLLSKTINFDQITKELKPILFDECLDSVLGLHQVTKGVLVLFFSHKLNKQIAVVISGNHDLVKVSSQIDDLMKGIS